VGTRAGLYIWLPLSGIETLFLGRPAHGLGIAYIFPMLYPTVFPKINTSNISFIMYCSCGYKGQAGWRQSAIMASCGKGKVG
jgi:hypothetical protein